jgi:pseudaminic acid cytidylyltransferase
MKKDNICIIPARGGSKRIPKKNIKLFYGKPIISYPIEMAIKSNLFEKVIVSTDDNKIATIAKKYGATIHNRPKLLADDKTDTRTVIVDVIKSLEKDNFFCKKVCCIYPTSIFFNKSELIQACKKLLKNINYIFSATKYDHPIFRSFKKSGKKIKMVIPRMEKKRTQDLEEYYHDAAQFYFGWKKSWIKKKRIFHGSSSFVEIPKLRSQDLDNLEDWKNAKILWKVKKYSK